MSLETDRIRAHLLHLKLEGTWGRGKFYRESAIYSYLENNEIPQSEAEVDKSTEASTCGNLSCYFVEMDGKLATLWTTYTNGDRCKVVSTKPSTAVGKFYRCTACIQRFDTHQLFAAHLTGD